MPKRPHELVPMDRIRTDGDTQPRHSMHLPTIEDYAELYKLRVGLPSVVVFYDGEAYWLADGFHRVRAAQKLSAKQIRCEIFDGSQRDAMIYSLSANQTHGLRRTAQDKRNAVVRCLNDEEMSRFANEKIAETCGVTKRFVYMVKSDLRGEDDTRIDEVPNDERSSYEDSKEQVSSKAEDPPQEPPPPEVPKDKVGNEIPQELRNVFEFGDVYQSLMNGLSDIKRRANEISGGPQGVFLRMNQFEKHITDARTVLKFARPYAVCPYCGNSNPDCEACKGFGFVNEPAYNAAPDEMKAVPHGT